MDVKVAKDVYIPKEKIKHYSSYEYNWVKNLVREAKKNGAPVFNYTAGKAIATVIFLDDGTIYLVNTSTATINSRMDPGNAQSEPEPQEQNKYTTDNARNKGGSNGSSNNSGRNNGSRNAKYRN